MFKGNALAFFLAVILIAGIVLVNAFISKQMREPEAVKTAAAVQGATVPEENAAPPDEESSETEESEDYSNIPNSEIVHHIRMHPNRDSYLNMFYAGEKEIG